MQCIFITVLLVVVSLNITTTAADCIERDVIVGTGYNLIFGNPQANKPEDPGLKRIPILALTYDEPKKHIKIKGRDICVPKEVIIEPVTKCSNEHTQTIRGAQSYRKELEKYVILSGGSDFRLSLFSFSMSKEFKKFLRPHYVYIDKEAHCYISTQQYKLGNIPTYGVSHKFFIKVLSLPTTKPRVPGKGEELAYYEFLTKWGTHIIVEAKLGGRYLERTYKFAKKHEKFTLSTGSQIKKVDNRWEVPDGDPSIPKPVTIHLVSIDTVCSHNGYWDKYTPKLKITADPLKTICSNLRYALMTYVDYFNLKSTLWPDGTYGFPKANTGCPNEKFENGYLSTWQDRTRMTYNHFAGWNDKARFEFCMKTATYYDNLSKFGKGNYCLYKLDTCPSGFTVGYFEDITIYSRKVSSTGGILPDGKYGTYSWNIQYCCRKDAESFKKPMTLPNHRPFYLIRIGGNCQYVKGMKVRKESIEWTCSFEGETVAKGLLRPDVEIRKLRSEVKSRCKIFYCYYH